MSTQSKQFWTSFGAGLIPTVFAAIGFLWMGGGDAAVLRATVLRSEARIQALEQGDRDTRDRLARMEEKLDAIKYQLERRP